MKDDCSFTRELQKKLFLLPPYTTELKSFQKSNSLKKKDIRQLCVKQQHRTIKNQAFSFLEK